MDIAVYKFGGASLATPELLRSAVKIAGEHRGKLVIVTSAMAKTTNALEAVVNTRWDGDFEKAQELLQDIEQFHQDYIQDLFAAEIPSELEMKITQFMTEIEWELADTETKTYNYFYDQIVSVGELISTAIFSAYAQSQNQRNTWLDARDLLRTDDSFREAKVDVDWSRTVVQNQVKPSLEEEDWVVTQGFIGSTDQNENTTLGREGSDYSASLFANFLDAESLTIWKDVDGLLNADPREFDDTVLIEKISYREVVEMAYYGAQVIHPKTIKPLYEKNIPLFVRSFVNEDAKGTVISNFDEDSLELPPITVVKHRQLLLRISTRDFSFFDEEDLSTIYSAFAKLQLKQNMTQVSAISMDILIDDKRNVVKRLEEILSERFEIQFFTDKKLVTVRHYGTEDLEQLENERDILILSKTPVTFRFIK